MTMRIYQPMLYVGLGGTGCLIGAELERRLRAELCGPDGTAITNGDQRARFQLPDCLQFLYADFSDSELSRLPHLSAQGPERAAFARTARAAHDLLPHQDSSVQVTQMLRIALDEEVSGWLPPYEGEPKVAPLSSGAGQLPTVGRAALFATLRYGPEPVLASIRQTVDAIGRAGGDLRELGGQRLRGCDVFVGFSVAGGTGGGIFYDYLHLLGHAFHTAHLEGVKIYPLVVMPSAFPPERGGGREAELNAARAAVDLFRLVDDQNVPDASSDLGHVEHKGSLQVKYPEMHPVRLRTSTVQTAFLFSRTAGIRPDDLRRSIVSLVMSLISTELDDSDPRGPADDDYQTFAASFVNKGIQRAARASSGIGHRGVSTSLVASMTVPTDELGEIFAARVLAAAVRQLADGPVDARQDDPQRVRAMFEASNIGPLWTREGLPVPLPDPLPRGSREIGQALHDRIGDMENLLQDLDRRTARSCAELADAFTPWQGAERLLERTDLFELERVVNGVRGAKDPVLELGFAGMLDNRREEPVRRPGVGQAAPAVPRIRRRVGGAIRARWGDPDVVAAVEEQDAWYEWRTRKLWHHHWRQQEPRWRSRLNQLRGELVGIVAAFRQHAESERESFRRRVRELYLDRTGVSYLLPPQTNLKGLYDGLMARLLKDAGLGEKGEGEGALLLRIVSGEQWKRAFEVGRRDPQAAVSLVKKVLEEQIQKLFAEGPLGERPLLPSLDLLLRAEAGDGAAAEQVSKQARDQFRFKLAALLPGGFTPEGDGLLRILIVYPAAIQTEDRVRKFLEQELQLPRDERREIDYRAGSTQSITVVMFRSQMSLTQVPEVRNVLQLWARSAAAEGPGDVLQWRQRLGYQDEWLVSTERDRVHILHRLLSAMWNGQVEVSGPAASPDSVRIRLRESGTGTMTLKLDQYDRGLSSWTSLLRAYERWALLDAGGITEEFCKVLMTAAPRGLSTSPSDPHPLFRTFVDQLPAKQVALLDGLAAELGADSEEWIRPLRRFWADTLPAALDLPFPSARPLMHRTLRGLDAALRSPSGRAGSGSHRPAPENGEPPQPGGDHVPGLDGEATSQAPPDGPHDVDREPWDRRPDPVPEPEPWEGGPR